MRTAAERTRATTMSEFSTGFQYLMLIMARVMGLLFTAPVLSTEGVGVRTRMVLAFFVAVVLYSGVMAHLPPLPENPGSFLLAVVGQAIVGIVIGFMITVILSAFQMAGEIFSVQMGISFSEVLDPQAEVSIPVLGTLKSLIGLLLFLTVDFTIDGQYVPAYLHMLRALGESFVRVPQLVPETYVLAGLTQHLDRSLGVMFITALKIGLPVMGILFITSVALGLLGRAAPQMNLMNMGIQLNIIIGILVLFVLGPVVVPLMLDSFHRTYAVMGEMFGTWPKTP